MILASGGCTLLMWSARSREELEGPFRGTEGTGKRVGISGCNDSTRNNCRCNGSKHNNYGCNDPIHKYSGCNVCTRDNGTAMTEASKKAYLK